MNARRPSAVNQSRLRGVKALNFMRLPSTPQGRNLAKQNACLAAIQDDSTMAR